MKSTQKQTVYYTIGCLIFTSLLVLSLVSKKASITSAYREFYGADNLFDIVSKAECVDIASQKNQCKFVQKNCSGFNAVYLELYYCSKLWKSMSIAILLSCLLLLFGAISVVASDFFCPNLQTISFKLHLSESMAGVTILALGNGSPDLFSTFSALNSNAGSLAIGELIGAAFFIVAIVSGCMGIIKPFKSQKITFMRDASFLTGAIIIISWIVYHQSIHWYHSVVLIAYYLSYVFVVVAGTWIGKKNTSPPCAKGEQDSIMDEATHLLNQKDRPLGLSIPSRGFTETSTSFTGQNHLGHIIHPTSPNSNRSSIFFDSIPRSTSMNGSMTSKTYRRPMTPRIGMRTSLFGAIEFQDQVNSIKRANSSLSILSNDGKRYRQNSMPPPMWQKLQGVSNRPPPPLGRQRASTMTERMFTIPMHTALSPIVIVPATPSTEDYFTYLSSHPTVEDQLNDTPTAPELSIPEIRLATPNNEQSTTLDANHLQYSRSRASTHQSLAPPGSVLSIDNDDASLFYSASQSFEISPLHSFDFNRVQQHHQLHIPMTAGTCLVSTGPVHYHRTTSEYSFPILPRQHWIQQVGDIILPTLQGWKEKSLFAKLSGLAAAPLVFIFTLTLPVAEIEQIKIDDIQVKADDDEEEDLLPVPVMSQHNLSSPTFDYLSVPRAPSDLDFSATEGKIVVDDLDIKQGWNKYLLIAQCIISTTFIFGVFAMNGLIPYSCILIGLLLGTVISVFVSQKTRVEEPPSWFWILSFVGFFVSLNWIFLLANEVVGLLQAMGEIFSISEAIMGLTVFALGNSIGDFVANTAIAKMGFPTMAISACYAGPLLNMVLGVGVSSFYQTWKTGHAYQLDIAPTIMVSSFGLITVLVSTLVVVSINGYHVTKSLGWWMISVYLLSCSINFLLEFEIIAF